MTRIWIYNIQYDLYTNYLKFRKNRSDNTNNLITIGSANKHGQGACNAKGGIRIGDYVLLTYINNKDTFNFYGYGKVIDRIKNIMDKPKTEINTKTKSRNKTKTNLVDCFGKNILNKYIIRFHKLFILDMDKVLSCERVLLSFKDSLEKYASYNAFKINYSIANSARLLYLRNNINVDIVMQNIEKFVRTGGKIRSQVFGKKYKGNMSCSDDETDSESEKSSVTNDDFIPLDNTAIQFLKKQNNTNIESENDEEDYFSHRRVIDSYPDDFDYDNKKCKPGQNFNNYDSFTNVTSFNSDSEINNSVESAFEETDAYEDTCDDSDSNDESDRFQNTSDNDTDIEADDEISDDDVDNASIDEVDVEVVESENDNEEDNDTNSESQDESESESESGSESESESGSESGDKSDSGSESDNGSGSGSERDNERKKSKKSKKSNKSDNESSSGEEFDSEGNLVTYLEDYLREKNYKINVIKELKRNMIPIMIVPCSKFIEQTKSFEKQKCKYNRASYILKHHMSCDKCTVTNNNNFNFVGMIKKSKIEHIVLKTLRKDYLDAYQAFISVSKHGEEDKKGPYIRLYEIKVKNYLYEDCILVSWIRP